MILAVECSTAQGSVAVFDGTRCVACRESPTRMAGGMDAGAMMAAVFSDIGGAGAITQCAAGVGPGSFSGIRSVLGYLQGFCAPRGLPIIGIPGAAVCARALAIDGTPMTASIIGDARRGHYWRTDYRWDGSRLHETSPLRIIPYEKLSIVNGQLSTVYSPEPERIQAEGVARVIPTAREVALLALESPALTAAPLPLYLHPAV